MLVAAATATSGLAAATAMELGWY
eukprot:COSAG02_NODE_21875_length_772_cov_0.476969_1_plen_23_part_10